MASTGQASWQRPAVDAFHHVDVVTRRAARAVVTGLGLNRDGLSRADRFAQFAGDAALFAVRVATERVLATEPGRQRPLLKGIVDRHFLCGRNSARSATSRKPVL